MSRGAVAAALSVVLFAQAASAANVPNPCKLVPAATVAKTVGLTGATPTGKLSTRPGAGVTQSLCTYKSGATTIEVVVAPHAPSGGSGGPAGMKEAKPAGLGSGVTDYYDTTAPYFFANVFFNKGKLDGGAYASGRIPNARIVALAHLVYKALP